MTTKSVELVVAVADYGAIGNNGYLVWTNKKDLARFKELTNGYPVIMGRKTWESLPRKPLPNRLNIVVSSKFQYDTNISKNPHFVVNSLQRALELVAAEKVFVIGGARLYEEAEKICSKIHLTRVYSKFKADTYMPHIDYTQYDVSVGESFVDDNDITVIFYTYTKK